jgi:tight adherence protein B
MELPVLLLCLLWGAAAALMWVWVGPSWDAITGHLVSYFTGRMQELNLDTKAVPKLLRWWGMSVVGSVAFFGILGMWPLAAAAAWLILVSPRLLLESWIRRRSILLRDQLVSVTIALANASRAGLGLAQGIDNVAKEASDPMASELKRIYADYERGRPLQDAIRDCQNRLKLDSFTLFSNAILVAIDRGGKITEALDRISRSLSENQRLERKLEAETASGRRVVTILAAFPFIFLALFGLIDPEGVSKIFSTLVGQIGFAAVILLVYICIRWSGKILNLQI